MDEVLAVITEIVNLSKVGGVLPSSLNEAVGTPMMKKAKLPLDFLKR